MMFRSKKFLFVVLSISCLTVANCQEDKKEDGEKDPVGPATLATPTALFKCDEVTNDPFFSPHTGRVSLPTKEGESDLFRLVSATRYFWGFSDFTSLSIRTQN